MKRKIVAAAVIGATLVVEIHSIISQPADAIGPALVKQASSSPSDLLNISTRARVLSGDNVMIAGFILTGTEPKKIIIRGIGPSLAQFFGGVLADPTLELYEGNTLLATNDNWKTRPDGSSQQGEVEATGIPPIDDSESAIVQTLSPGSYTAILRGKNSTTGIGVVEAYDLNQASNSKVGNIATRGFVDTGDNVMIGGLIVGPSDAASTNVVVRAIGPTLGNFGIAGALQDPTLELYNSNGTTVATNDNWKTRSDGSSQEAVIEATGLKPADDRESSLVQTLTPGSYTAIVRGNGETSGAGLVEVYNVPNIRVVTVPDVTGLNQGAATTVLNNAELVVGSVTQENSESVPVGNIIRQTPMGGASVLPGSAVNLVVSVGASNGLPPDPALIAPPLDPTIGSDLASATKFLYTGPNPIQSGVAPGTIQPARAAVLKGRVFDRNGVALSAVSIFILGHPELGRTLTRNDGAFDLAVNGGGQLTVCYEKEGFLSAQRAIVAPWRDYAALSDVVLVPFDNAVTQVDLSAGTMQVARGSVMADADGTRQATVLVPAGTTAEMVLPNGSRQALHTLRMRATEYTVGESGPKAMPAPLPPSSGYTYCVEFSVDEAVSAGATEVRFNQPLPAYVENFVGFPVGTAVPTGYYDRQKGQWIASANGRVLKVVGISNGVADLDVDGDGSADAGTKLTALGITDVERTRLGQLYSSGQTLWRVPITHFTPYDCNWPYGPPPGAVPPPGRPPFGRRPPGGNPNSPPVNQPNETCGSVIGCENQSLGESLPVTGSSWDLHYRSGRTPGRKDAYTVDIPLSGASVPPGLRQIRLEVNIAGHEYREVFAPAPDLSHSIVWDGRDVYGRLVQGRESAVVKVHYDYAAQYYAVRADLENSFARAEAAGAQIAATRAASTITFSQTWTEIVGSWDARSAGLGGWTLAVHHAYDRAARMLLLGDGRQRSADALSLSTITTVAGNNQPGSTGDGGPAANAQLDAPRGIAVAPDGSVLVADSEAHRVRRIGPDGIITTVAGNGNGGFSGDSGPATAAQLFAPHGIAIAADGSFYIADYGNRRIRWVRSDGVITTVAGNGIAGSSGDGGPATAARLNSPVSVAVGPDGSLFIADINGNRVRRVGPDGIITTIAGNGNFGFSGDGGPASAAQVGSPRGVAAGPDGSVYIAVSSFHRVRRIAPDGVITTVAGTGTAGFSGDGGSASAAQLNVPDELAVGTDGTVFIVDFNNARIRSIGPDGIIATVAGKTPGGFSGDGGPATAARLGASQGVAVAPDGSLYIADRGNHRVRCVRPSFPEFSLSDILLASDDAREVYLFSSSGRHLKTLEALTGAVRLQFGYSTSGYLTSVTDSSGNVTTIERSGAMPVAIVAAGGQRTTLNTTPDGWLSSASNPANEVHDLTYSADGLLQTFRDPRGNRHRFIYNSLGRLTTDENPAEGSITLDRTEQGTGYTVTTTTALGRTHIYQIEQLPGGAVHRTVTQPSGTKTVTEIGTDGSEKVTYATGEIATVQYGPDPRWGTLAPVPASVVMKTPGGLTRTITTTRTAILTDPDNVLSLSKLTETVTDNGAARTSVYDGPSRVLTRTTAGARSGTVRLDSLGRVIEAGVAGLEPTSYAYDSLGRLSTITEGTGPQPRVFTLGYNGKNELITIQDPLSRTAGFAYDLAGRITTQSLPDASAIQYGYDANGNVTSLTPPGKPAHGSAYTPINLTSSYTPPDIGIGSTATHYSYNADRSLTQITRPDDQLVDITYDGAGRRASVTITRGSIGYTYDSAGRLNAVTAPGALGLSYSYDGHLLTGVTASGAVSGTVAGSYNANFQLASLTVNGASPISLSYDADRLLTRVGGLTLSRSARNGLVTGTALGAVTDVRTYNGYAELATYAASTSGAPLLNVQYTRDLLGRITTRTETIAGVTDSYVYSYDLIGRLTGVDKNGAAVEAYSYDLNGNRVSETRGGAARSATYDAQDRVTEYGGTTYSYTAAGELATKTTSGQTTTHSYDQLGNLLSVAFPVGPTISYLVDGENRRVGKKINGALVQGFLYQNNLRPEAELDGAGSIVSRFVYATNVNVPAYMVKGGAIYRIITDHLGSPRLVLNTSNGAVVQRMDYDSFGQVLLDTNPGFQPFGFAGGLYDHDTGLVRFGARDYDAATGRWTARDPILFRGGQTNLYAYATNDPVNLYDPTGLFTVPSFEEIKGLFAEKALDEALDSTEVTKTGKEVYDAVEDAIEFAEDVRDIQDACESGDPARGFDVLKKGLKYIPNLPDFAEELFTGAIEAVENSAARAALGRLGRSEDGSGTSNVNIENQLRQLPPGLAP